MNIIEMPLHELIPYENNPRKNDEAVAKVAASIEQFGFKVPIIVDRNNVIIAGHTRWKAAAMLAIETVPVIRADDLTEEQVKAFRLADNKVGEFSGWDFEKLEKELNEIGGIDMSEFGFLSSELSDLTAEEADGGEIEDNEKAEIAVKIRFPSLKTWRENEQKLRELVDTFENVSVSVGKSDEDIEGDN